jgi:hypothetical protein
MTRISITRPIDAPAARVWAVMSDLESHVVWMRDARSIDFLTDQTEGVGTVMDVATRIGPFRSRDVIEVVGWDDGRSIEIVHRGLVTGRGVLALAAGSDGTTLVTWGEHLFFPWWLGGAFTGLAARPVLTAVWRANLRRLEALVRTL